MTEPAAARSARKAAERGRAAQREAFLAARAGVVDRAALDAAMAALTADAPPAEPVRPAAAARKTRRRAAALPLPRAFVGGDARRWVPIGPAAVRLGLAENRPRVGGRIRDLAVDGTGTRAYAASAKGGVWYTEDAGAFWRPVGGWADRPRTAGGINNAQSCGCLLVNFGANPGLDFVMVGTGELTPSVAPTGHLRFGGIGVLAALGPAAAAIGANPWEAASGLAQMEGLGIYRLARDPAAVAGKNAAPNVDRVLAATSGGLFLGTRRNVAAPPPPHDEFVWAKLPGPDAAPGLLGPAVPVVTDVLWLAGGPSPANGRIIIAVDQNGVAFSDDLGANFAWVTNLDPNTMAPGIADRVTLTAVTGTARGYVLGATVLVAPAPAPPAGFVAQQDTPSLWQIPNLLAAVPAASAPIPGVHPSLWGTQGFYDQAIAVDVIGGQDRVFIGGSTCRAPGGNTIFSASLWCFDVVTAPALALTPAPNISRVGTPAPPPGPPPPPPAGDGADVAGLIGNNVHSDIHAIRLVTVGPQRQVWVGCDGGVFQSTQGGRVNTFASRSSGMAALEVGFVATHPTSSHFLAIGCQDNALEVRTGDAVWEAVSLGDGGGVVIHPVQSQFVVGQAFRAVWRGRPPAAYVAPMSRSAGGDGEGGANFGRESGLSAFYAGAATFRINATTARLSVGTNRVWVTNDLGTAAPNTWRALPFPGPAASSDVRPGGADALANQAFGVPGGGALAPVNAIGQGPLGPVITMRWVTSTDLLVVFAAGLVRWTQNPGNFQWTANVVIPGTAGAPNPANTVLTDVFPVPVPGSQDFYLACTGDAAVPPGDTLFFFDAATNQFFATNLRHALDVGGVVGPLDPAYSIAVDPLVATDVYVGTATGVWRGVRGAGPPAAGNPWPHGVWTAEVNGLPQAAVQDLSIWSNPGAPAGPRLLRAGVQARGVWEFDLQAAATGTPEPVRTYQRVHARDDRRRFPTPMANPRRAPTAAPEPVFASPDIVVRPQPSPPAAPTWQLGPNTIRQGNVVTYQLWTFQTAFRWSYPSVSADGLWTDAFGDLIELHRAANPALGAPPAAALGGTRSIDQALWNLVVGGTHLDANGQVTGNALDPLAVYRPAWTSPAALNGRATEVDLIENVQPPRILADVWQVFSEASTVDVLIHHRDTRQLVSGEPFVILLWRFAAGAGTLLGLPAAPIVAFVAQAATRAVTAPPAGWNLVTDPAGLPVNTLSVPLDARMPRAVSLNVNLTPVPNLNRVLFLAIAGSGTAGVVPPNPAHDPCTAAPVGLTAASTVSDLVQRWPYAALRLVRVSPRPP